MARVKVGLIGRGGIAQMMHRLPIEVIRTDVAGQREPAARRDR